MDHRNVARRLLATLAFTFFLPGMVQAAPQVDHVMVTDVTTRSFSVIWTSDEAASNPPTLEVFENSDATGLVGDYTPTPLRCDASLQTVAENLGVMKVQVTGLNANTMYYFRTVTDSASGQTVYPDGADPLLEVTTATQTVRTDAANNPISNDIIISDWEMADALPADGTIVFASATGASYPMTSFVGDCAPSGSALIDLNNMFDRETGQNIDLTQGINLNLVNFRGTDGVTQIVHEVPQDNLLAEVKGADPMIKPGWNMFATEATPRDTAIRTNLQPLIDDGSLVSAWQYNQDNGLWKTFDPTFPDNFNSLKDILPYYGYWFELTAPSSVRIEGPNISDVALPISGGWNMVGSILLESLPPREYITYMSGPGSVMTIWFWDTEQNGWLTFNPTFPDNFNSLKYIEPGKSYWIEASQDCGDQLCEI